MLFGKIHSIIQSSKTEYESTGIRKKKDERMRTVMKNFFAQTGKALAYFATYMGAQLAASVGASFIFSMVVGYRAAANGQKLTYDESVANTAQLVSGNIGYMDIRADQGLSSL